jgi:hypothetical protein
MRGSDNWRCCVCYVVMKGVFTWMGCIYLPSLWDFAHIYHTTQIFKCHPYFSLLCFVSLVKCLGTTPLFLQIASSSFPETSKHQTQS